jgi:hypothetical protein
MCITLRLELMTSCIASCVLYHQGTIEQSLVLRMVCTRYLHTRQDTLDLWYLLAGVDIQRGSRRAPGFGHDITGPDISFDVQDAHLAAEQGFEAAMLRWTAARLRNSAGEFASSTTMAR